MTIRTWRGAAAGRAHCAAPAQVGRGVLTARPRGENLFRADGVGPLRGLPGVGGPLMYQAQRRPLTQAEFECLCSLYAHGRLWQVR
jgi:hypothetical protein